MLKKKEKMLSTLVLFGIIGGWNTSPVFAADAIGQGAVARDAVYDSGNYGAVAIGKNATALGGDATAVGADAYSDHNSIAVGSGAKATGTSRYAYSIAVGSQAKSSADEAISIGYNAAASGYRALALGSGAVATGQNSVAIGTGTVVNEDNAVGIGNRRIIQVANGVNRSDAVNVGQLRDEIGKGFDASDKADKNLGNITDAGKQVIRSTVVGDIANAQNQSIQHTNDAISNLRLSAEADAKVKADNAAADAKADANRRLAEAKDSLNKTIASTEKEVNDTTASKANETASNAKNYTDIMTNSTRTYARNYTDEIAKTKANIGMDNINEDGKNVIRELARESMSNSGIDATGKTIVISKPMQTKDISMDGNLDVSGHIHANGDITGDKNFYLKGDSFVGGNSTVEKDLYVKGNIEANGDQLIHGNQTIDGNSETGGNSHVKGDFSVDGNTRLGDDKTKDTVNIYAETHLHGDTVVGDDSGDVFIINATSEFKADSTFDKNVHIKGNLETDGNSYTHGNSKIDGDMSVRGDVSIEKDLHVNGDVNVDSDIYGKSFNVGDKRYIDKNGINANGQVIRNVADGRIAPDSTDAINGRQLYKSITSASNNLDNHLSTLDRKLTKNINQVGAGAAAMSNLHPIDFNRHDKLSVSASIGNYRGETALATGVFYRPDKKSMFSISSTVGYGDNMVAAGFSKSLGENTGDSSVVDSELGEKFAEAESTSKKLLEINHQQAQKIKELEAALKKAQTKSGAKS